VGRWAGGPVGRWAGGPVGPVDGRMDRRLAVGRSGIIRVRRSPKVACQNAHMLASLRAWVPFPTRAILTWVGVVVAAIIVGSLGYVVLEGWSFGDALYMTVITMTTVGFQEVRKLDDSGRVWTMVVAVGGVAIIFGTISLVFEGLVGEFQSGRREAIRMRESIAALRGHFILCGYGRVGSTVARELVHSGQRLVVVDINHESLERARADGHLIVDGDATLDETLREAGIERARGLITTIDSDANNVYVTLSARSLNPSLFIVGRANLAGSEAKLGQAGANRIVSPYTMAGRRIAELATRPRVTDFIDAALSHGELAFTLEDLEVASGGPLAGRSVADLRGEGIFVLAILRGERSYLANPPDDRVVAAGESIIVSGSAETLGALRARA
jgi:voltage-gated potassium channel